MARLANLSACDYGADNEFGPAIACPQFDFTLMFEQSVLSITISSLFLLVLPFRINRFFSAGESVAQTTQKSIQNLKNVSL
jgi:hypothetical protein